MAAGGLRFLRNRADYERLAFSAMFGQPSKKSLKRGKELLGIPQCLNGNSINKRDPSIAQEMLPSGIQSTSSIVMRPVDLKHSSATFIRHEHIRFPGMAIDATVCQREYSDRFLFGEDFLLHMLQSLIYMKFAGVGKGKRILHPTRRRRLETSSLVTWTLTINLLAKLTLPPRTNFWDYLTNLHPAHAVPQTEIDFPTCFSKPV